MNGPGQFLVSRFVSEVLRQTIFEDVAGFEIHYHQLYQLLPAINCNLWMRAKAAPEGGPIYDHLAVQQDLNTVASEGASYDAQQLSDFFNAAESHIDNLINATFDGGPIGVHAA